MIVGRPPTYPFRHMVVGDSVTLPAPNRTAAKRICSNASQYGARHGRFYQCLTENGQTTVTRVE